MSISIHTHRRKSWSVVAIGLLAALLAAAAPASAQTEKDGIVKLADWPPQDERRNLDHQVLPFIDTLYVSYAFDSSTERPSLSLGVEWLPEGRAVIQQKLMRLDEIPGTVRMVALELEAGVYVDDVRAATMALVVDSMMTGPSPDFVRVTFPDLSWSNLFVDVSGEEARSIVAQGFELREPEVMHVAFAYYTTGAGAGTTGDAGPVVGPRPRPREVSVYPRHTAADVVFDLFWLLGSGDRYVDLPRDGKPRGTSGRGSLDDSPRSRSARAGEDRSAREEDADEEKTQDGRGGLMDLLAGGDDDDDDDDKDDKLVPYAVAAVGAAGLLAVAGGTIGYYGNARYAPYGLTSGLVRRDGGLLLQVGANESLLSDGEEPKHLTAKLLAFGNLFAGGIQPALSGGILATSRGSEVTVEPSISAGAVGRRGALLLYGGYDFYQRGVELSLALNVRGLGFWSSREGSGD